MDQPAALRLAPTSGASLPGRRFRMASDDDGRSDEKWTLHFAT